MSEPPQPVKWAGPNAYDAWRQNNLHTAKIKTSDEASKVIEGLKGLKKRLNKHG